jgi:hypothetical protein
MLSVALSYHYAECHYAQRRSGECRGVGRVAPFERRKVNKSTEVVATKKKADIRKIFVKKLFFSPQNI